MEKVENRIYDCLPLEKEKAVDELDILKLVDCSHGSFYNSVKNLIAAGLVGIVKSGRRKLYYRIADDVSADDNATPDDSLSVKSAKKEKGVKLKVADYNDNCEGYFPDLQNWFDVISELPDYEYATVDDGKLLVGVNGGVLRYQYAKVKSGGFEVWRWRIKQTYKRKFVD